MPKGLLEIGSRRDSTAWGDHQCAQFCGRYGFFTPKGEIRRRGVSLEEII
jgi:hypothetical protein